MPIGIAFKGDSIAPVIYKGGAAAQADGDATQYGIKGCPLPRMKLAR